MTQEAAVPCPSGRSVPRRALSRLVGAELASHACASLQSRTWLLGDRHASDATVKLLQIQAHGQAPQALALEITYHPLSSYAEAGPALRELAGALQGALDAAAAPGGGGGGEGAARCAGAARGGRRACSGAGCSGEPN
jgi:hypothetical protein